MNEKNNSSSLLIGIAIGAALSYLFTTKNGQKIKDELIKEGSKLLDKIGESLEEAEKKSPELKKVKDAVEEVKDAVVSEAKEVQETAEEAIREVPQQVQQIQKKGRHFFFKRHTSSES